MTDTTTKQIRKDLSKFMDGAIPFKNKWLEGIDRLFWRGFFWLLFTVLSKYITTGLVEELEKVREWIKNENWTEFDDYVSDLVNKVIDIPFIDEEKEKQYFTLAIQFMHGTINLLRAKSIEITNKAEADDPILSDE